MINLGVGSYIKRIASLTLTTWSAQFVNIIGNIVLLPLIAKVLTEVGLGVWLAFLLWVSFSMLLDAGLSVTVSRFIAYSFKKENVGGISLRYLSIPPSTGDVILASSKIYVGINALVIIGVFVSLYFADLSIVQEYQGMTNLNFAIGVVLYTFMTLNASRISGILQGLGQVIKVKRIELIVNIIRLLLLLLALLLFKTLGALFIGAILSQTLRLLILRRVYTNDFVDLKSVVLSDTKIYKELLSTSVKVGLIGASGFVISSFTALYMTTLESNDESIEFLLLHKLLLTVFSFSMSILHVRSHEFNRYISEANYNGLLRVFRDNRLLSLLAYTVPTVIIALGWDFVAGGLFGITTGSLNRALMLIMLISGILEINHSYYATVYLAFNRIPFLLPSILSAVAIIMFLPLGLSRLGVTGIVLVPFTVQLLWNNWYPIWLVHRRLGWGLW